MASRKKDYDLTLSGQNMVMLPNRPILRPDEQIFPIGGKMHVVFRSAGGARKLGAYGTAADAVTVANVAAAAALKGDASYDTWESAFLSGKTGAEEVMYQPAPVSDIEIGYDAEGKYNLYVRGEEGGGRTLVLSSISYARTRRAIADAERHRKSGDFDAWLRQMTDTADAARERQYRRLARYAEAFGAADGKKDTASAKLSRRALSKKGERSREREREKSIRASRTAKPPYDWIFYLNGVFTVKAFLETASYKLGSYLSHEDAVEVSTAAHGAASEGSIKDWTRRFRKKAVKAGKAHFVSESRDALVDELEVDSGGRYRVFAEIGGKKTCIASFKSFPRAKKMYLAMLDHKDAGDLDSWAASFVEKESVRAAREAEIQAKASAREKRMPKGYYRNGRGAYFVQMKYKDRSYYVGCYYDEDTAVRIANEARDHITKGDFEEWLPGIREASGKRGRLFRALI